MFRALTKKCLDRMKLVILIKKNSEGGCDDRTQVYDARVGMVQQGFCGCMNSS